MTQNTRGSITAMLAIALIISSCVGGAANSDPAELTITSDPGGSITNVPAVTGSPEPQETTPSAPNPASIDIILEEGSAATAEIGAEGGSFELTDMNGTRYTLTIPEGALFSPVEITMTPIVSAEGEEIGDTFLAGVALQPEGLHFLELATLEITGDMIEQSALGFAAESGGQDFHLTPSKAANGSIAISITHFSEFGVSEEEVRELAAIIVPLAEGARNEHALTLGDDEQAMAHSHG